jgi:DNA repair protein RadA/Sms
LQFAVAGNRFWTVTNTVHGAGCLASEQGRGGISQRLSLLFLCYNLAVMAKSHTKYICQQCGYESAEWMGKCPSCGTWNSLVETLVSGQSKGARGREVKSGPVKLQTLAEIQKISDKRISTKIGEFDRVLGGGIVLGSVTLLAGDPGIGKSTLLLQAASSVPNVIYISGEESPAQIKIRAERLGVKNKDLRFMNETDVDVIIETIGNWELANENLVVIDSIQTLYTSDLTGTAGSVGQVRECTLRLLNLAKSKGISMFIVGHVTKEGAIAGPMVLAHLVDTVLFFEGEKYQSLRLLRAIKNRFGPTDEVGVFEMAESGLAEVLNPSKIFLGEQLKNVSGSVTTCLMEGTRPLMVEIQALVANSQLPIPRRVAQGIDYNRLQLLVAVLSRRAGLSLGNSDVFVNVAGGIKVTEPGADLAICLAIASAALDKPLAGNICAIGEIGLLGEIRPVGGLEKRIKESKRLGFEQVVSVKEHKVLRTAIKDLLG